MTTVFDHILINLGVRLFNPTNFEHHVDRPSASVLFTPQIEDSANSSNAQSASYNNSQFSPDQDDMQSTMLPSGGASGQQSFVPSPPASAGFAPAMDVGGAGVQTYMNPVLHNNVHQQQTPFFIPGPNPDLSQAAPHTEPPEVSSSYQLNVVTFLLNNSRYSQDHGSATDPSFDLHNGATNHGLSGSDQRYLNMAYNHNSSGVIETVNISS